VVAVLVLALAVGSGCCKRPDEAYDEFLTRNDREENLILPLLCGGRGVVPIVTRAIADRGMPRRLYAIQYLGVAGFPEGMPALTRIARDTSEEVAFRSEALRATWLLDQGEARRLALELSAEGAHGLEATINAIIAEDRSRLPYRRFYACRLVCQ